MQIRRVHHPDHEGPHLFSVPAPVAAPRLARPNSASGKRERPHHKRQSVQAERKILKGLGARNQAHKRPPARFTVQDALLAAGLHQLQHRHRERNRKHPGGKHRNRHVNHQPVALQRRFQVPHGGGETNGGGAHHNQRQPRHERAHEPQVTEDQRHQVHGHHHQRARGAELVHVPPRHTLRSHAAHNNRRRVHQRPHQHNDHGDARRRAALARVQHRRVRHMALKRACRRTPVPGAPLARAGLSAAGAFNTGGFRAHLNRRLRGGFPAGFLRTRNGGGRARGNRLSRLFLL